jgi:CRISPR-associated protein Cas6
VSELPPAAMVDVAFALQGRDLPRDHRLLLARALADALPWLDDEPQAAVHPVNVVHGLAETALLSQRTRLLLRVPRQRVQALQPLAGLTLQVGASELRLGAPQQRELLPHATLYAHFVDAGAEDEAGFLDTVAAALQTLDAACHSVCGRAHSVRGPEGPLRGFSLMLHGLRAAASQRIQEHGLGGHRLMGCGVFVPHKSAAAVGD